MNKVILIGRLARDPEMRTTGAGISMTRFTVAVSRPNTGQGQPQTDFINCIAWRRQAENIARYCTKGSQVAVDGRIQTGSYDGNDGQRRYTTDVVADNVTFLGSRSNGSTDDNSNSSSNYSNYGTTNNYQPSTPSTPSIPSFNEPINYPEPPVAMPTVDMNDDPFKDFGQEVALSDDDLPF